MDVATSGVTARDRDSVVSYHLSTLEDQFCQTEQLRFFIGTYNVNGQSPDKHLKEWLEVDQEPPDLYAVGFQELDLSKEAFVFMESVKEEEWTAIVTASLHSGAKYVLVKVVRLVGMMMLVYCKTELLEHISNVSVDMVGTGIMGKLGNKGGVGVSLRLHATELCFVNSHLAAHQEEYERRNQDYSDICSRMTFSQYERLSSDYPPLGYKRIKDFDTVFWMGDLNYRINDFDVSEVKELLAEENLSALLECDQLKSQQQHRRAFVEYEEGVITFRPTYKYDPGTSDWDSSEKGRSPAWTDRVLWRGDRISQTSYRNGF